MSSPFLAEIRMFTCNFAPKGWALCDGQILSLSQNTALFSLLGTTYGGNGTSNFALPNMQGNAPLYWGQGAGLSLYDIGEITGTETVSLLQTEIPQHTHGVNAEVSHIASLVSPTPTAYLGKSAGGNTYSTQSANLVQMSPNAISPAGGSQPHNNLQPYLVVNFCIALQGIYPARN